MRRHSSSRHLHLRQATLPPMTPIQKPGRSRQDYSTPDNFFLAVKTRFGHIAWGLAASDTNAKAFEYFTEEVDSLKQPWHKLERNWLWLNPPFGKIAPWVKKCAEEAVLGARILCLIPAAVGSNWWAEHVHGKARVFLISPRICFDGQNPFPKDCCLLAYKNLPSDVYECWRWDKVNTPLSNPTKTSS